MSAISVGRRVHYVMRDLQCRPFDVVRVWDNGLINGHVLLDGSNDSKNYWMDTKGELLMWGTSIKEDASKTTGTWHWPEKEGD